MNMNVGQNNSGNITAKNNGQELSLSQNSEDPKLKEEAEKLKKELVERQKNLEDRLGGASSNLSSSEESYREYKNSWNFFRGMGGEGAALEKQIETERKYKENLEAQKQSLLETQNRVAKLMEEGNYALAKAVMEGKEQEYKQKISQASNQAMKGLQDTNKKLEETDKFLTKTETVLRTTRDGCVVAAAIVATGGAASAGFVAAAAAGTAAGTAVGALSNTAGALSQVGNGNKGWGEAFQDAAVQTGKDALTSAQIGISGGAGAATGKLLLGQAGKEVAKQVAISTTKKVVVGMAAGATSGFTGSALQTSTNLAMGTEQRTWGQIGADTLRGTVVGSLSGGIGAKGQAGIDQMTANGTNTMMRTFAVRATADVAAPTALSLGSSYGSHYLFGTPAPTLEQSVQEVSMAILSSHVGAKTVANQQSGRTIRQEFTEMPTFAAMGTSIKNLYARQAPPPVIPKNQTVQQNTTETSEPVEAKSSDVKPADTELVGTETVEGNSSQSEGSKTQKSSTTHKHKKVDSQTNEASELAQKIENDLADPLLKSSEITNNNLLNLLSKLKDKNFSFAEAAKEAGLEPAVARNELISFLRKNNRPDLAKALDHHIDNQLKQLRTGKNNQVRSVPSEELSFLVDSQINGVSVQEIKTIIDSFPPNERQLAIKTLKEMSQFGNLDSINEVVKHLQSMNDSRAFIDGKNSLQDFIAYLKDKGNFDGPGLPKLIRTTELHDLMHIGPPAPRGSKVAFVLDEVFLARLESDPKLVQHLKDLQSQHGFDIKFVYPEGMINGINPFNHRVNTRQKLSSIMQRAKEIQTTKGVSESEAISIALNEPVLNRLKNLGLEDNLKVIKNDKVSDLPETPETIASNLASKRMSTEQIEEMISNLPEKFKPYARELLARDLVVYSQERLTSALQSMHKKILIHASDKNISPDDIYYLIPEGGKSYGNMTMQYQLINGIKPGRVVTSMDQVPQGSSKNMVVILDDVMATGGSLFGKTLLPEVIMKDSPHEVVVAPVLSSTTAKNLIDGLELEEMGIKFITNQVVTPFKDTDYYKSLPKSNQVHFDLLMKYLGYGEQGLSIIFPTGTPNNNNSFTSEKVAPNLTLNGRGIKNVSKYQIQKQEEKAKLKKAG